MRPLVLLAFLAASTPAIADHPGELLDETTANLEPAFESAAPRLPTVVFRTEEGAEIDISGIADNIVVLSFYPAACGTPCANQQARLADVQQALEITPMRSMVTFVTVASPEVPPLKSWESHNWIRANAPDEPAAAAGTAYRNLSRRPGNGPTVHVIDRGGRHAAIFHGASFEPINMVVYINGLTNAHPPRPSLLDRMLGWLPW